MELSQMMVQGLWDRDHTLLQVPHFTKELVAKIEASGEEVESVFDILSLDDGVRDSLLEVTTTLQQPHNLKTLQPLYWTRSPIDGVAHPDRISRARDEPPSSWRRAAPREAVAMAWRIRIARRSEA
jgi:hypothetical protein